MAQSSSIVSIFSPNIHITDRITCICLLQNLFPKGSQIRNISLNTNYIVLMKNSRDRAQVRYLARQVYPGNSDFLIKAYEDATRDPFTYLLLDFKNTTPDNLRVRTGVLPGEIMYSYVHPTAIIYKKCQFNIVCNVINARWRPIVIAISRNRKSDLLYICCQSPKFRKKLLKHADNELVKCICESAHKVLNGSIPM